jgi:hypothetical protein
VGALYQTNLRVCGKRFLVISCDFSSYELRAKDTAVLLYL